MVGMMAAMSACGSSSSTTTASPSSSLDAELITPAQVGAGIRVQQIQGGHSVAGQVTLDLCRFAYTSGEDGRGMFATYWHFLTGLWVYLLLLLFVF